MSTVEYQTDAGSEGPLISVIMIFLNEEEFIDEAIASVFAQSYANWELILVDDGSSDSSTDTAQRWVDRHRQNVRYLEHLGHRNLGMSASRNLGISHARGKYIAFLDADDVWLPGKLERQVTILESQPEAALVCAPAQFWYSWTGAAPDVQRDFVQKLAVEPDCMIEPPTLLGIFLEDEWASLCDVLVRRSAIEAVGGYENSFRGMYEDQVFHAKLCLKYPVIVSSECWYRYRQHPRAHTVVSNSTGHYHETREKFLGWIEEHLSKAGMKDTGLWKLLRREQWRLRHLLLLSIVRAVQRIPAQIKNFLKQSGGKHCLA